MFIVDIKMMDSDKHKQLTGIGNKLILENISKLRRRHSNILFRTPLIPGINDDEENIISTAKFLSETDGGIRGLELLKYNNVARSKYQALNIDMPFYAEDTQSDETLKRLQTAAKTILSGEFLIL